MAVRRFNTDKQKAGAGFTLVEIMMGAAALGIMMLAFFLALGSGFAILNNARQDLRATQVLTQKTEAVRLCRWDQLASLPHQFQDYYYTNTASGVTYYGKISIGPPNGVGLPPAYSGQIDLVTVSLVWTNYFGAHVMAHSRTNETLVAQNGLVNYIPYIQ